MRDAPRVPAPPGPAASLPEPLRMRLALARRALGRLREEVAAP